MSFQTDIEAITGSLSEVKTDSKHYFKQLSYNYGHNKHCVNRKCY